MSTQHKVLLAEKHDLFLNHSQNFKKWTEIDLNEIKYVYDELNDYFT